MTKEELDYIQTVCRKLLQQPGKSTGGRITIPASSPMSRPVELEFKGILTFDNTRITSAVDAETGVCYTNLIEQRDGLSEFFDAPLEEIVPDSTAPNESNPAALRPTQQRYHDAMQRYAEERRDVDKDTQAIELSSWLIEKQDSDSDERPKYQLYTNGILLGYSLLERERSAGQRSGRFQPSEDYFEYAPIFAELPEAENEYMEVNARAAYGLATEESDATRTRFHDLSAQVVALNLYLACLASETETRIEAAEIRLEDLSGYYKDQSERWLHVVIAAKPEQS